MAQGNSHPWCQQPEQSLIHESFIFEFYCSPTKLSTFAYLVSKTTPSIVSGHFLGGVVSFWSPGSNQLTSVVRRWDGMESWAFSPFVLEQARKTFYGLRQRLVSVVIYILWWSVCVSVCNKKWSLFFGKIFFEFFFENRFFLKFFFEFFFSKFFVEFFVFLKFFFWKIFF